MKKLFLMLGSLSLVLLGFFIFKNQDIVNAETTNGWVDTSACSQTECGSDAGTKTQSKTTPGYTTPIVCEKTCDGVTEPFSTSRTVYENDYSETIYGEWGNWSDWHKDNKCSSSDENAGKCQDEKDSSKNPDVYRRRYRTVTVNDHVCPSGYTYLEVSGSNDCYKVETFSATITYGEKSNDPNHCHKETPVTPSIPSWASSDFGKLPELKDKVDSNICTGGVWVPEVVENKTVSCTIPENEVEACPVDVCPNLEGNQTEIPEGYELKN